MRAPALSLAQIAADQTQKGSRPTTAAEIRLTPWRERSREQSVSTTCRQRNMLAGDFGGGEGGNGVEGEMGAWGVGS